ncbi:MAG: universal stress protein [Chloroflexi bacterium]|nr:universal stress protein [Chloroflexota bacterium]
MPRRKMVSDAARGAMDSLLEGRQPVIILPLSDAPEAKAAMPMATTLAGVTASTIHILHVAERPLSPAGLLEKLNLQPGEVRGMLLDQISDTPAAAIAEAAAEKRASFIVMSTFGHRKPLSPVAEGVLKKAPCPVVFVRPESPRRGERIASILLPLDGTPTTAAAVGPAMEIAASNEARLDVLYVVASGAARPEEPGTLTAPRYMDQPQHEWPAWAREFVERFCTCPGVERPSLSTRLFLRRGEPAPEILGFAGENKTDLIVLVWRGLLRGKRAATIKAVLRHAPCPVLVLRTTAQ